jgi:hypothetical protein
MTDYRTPGVYLRNVEITPPKLLRMSVTGFTGMAARGPLNSAQPLTSWGQFRDIFGDFIGYGYLPFAIFGFFLNGGQRCYITRIAHETALASVAARVSTQLTAGLSSGATQATLDSVDGISAGDALTLADNSRAFRLVAKEVELVTKRITFDDDPIPAGVSFSSGAKVIDRTFDVRAINEGVWGNALLMVVEENSTSRLSLTELDEDLAANATTVKFKSVAGLIGEDAAGPGESDRVVLAHRRDPVRKELTIKSINFLTREVAFVEPSESAFPAGSIVFANGFKLTFRLVESGKLVREEIFDNISMNKAKEHYFVTRINGDPEEKDYVEKLRKGNSILVRVKDLSAESGISCARPMRVAAKQFENGFDDPSKVDVRHYTGYDDDAYFRPIPPGASQEEIQRINESTFGLASFEALNEIGLVAIPDLIMPDLFAYYAATPTTRIPREGIIFTKFPINVKLDSLKAGQRDLLKHCNRMGDRFAILDSPRGADTGRGSNKIEDWASDFQMLQVAKGAALYYPWLKHKLTDFGGRNLFIPPSGHIAGVYARTEIERGIGKAPANEVLQGVIEFEFCLNDAQQALLNPLSVNCLRSLPGRGLRIWGARTLSNEPLWRYVNVRRVCLAIIKQIIINLQWVVFEPNNNRLRDNIVATLRLFLNDLFKSGVLAGAKAEQAFFVKCDDETNPPEAFDRGELIVEVGFAPASPSEFILVTIKRTAESITAREQTQ